ncbi:unnamed protein product [Clonostachys rosea]|uniref:Rhodopsin domain-containing protein n=1 Tax=Bionectria ochroleuca TaxID=29856 RepID=A0ABY6TT90_BIOOC|nr:unnamed protein product [Clonostachys rosea]
MAMPDNTLVIYVVTITTFLLATIFIALRLVARYVTKVETWWDDWFALLAYLCAFGFSGVVIEWTLGAGLGRPLEAVNNSREDAYYQSRMLLWIGEIIYAFTLAFSKLSVLGFYWRLFRTSGIRIPIQILTGASIVWLVIRTFMAIFHCVPVHAFWDLTVNSKVCNIDDSRFFFGTVLVHLIIDALILVLPVVQVKNLRLRLGQKIAVIGIFMFGILVCVASIGVLVESTKFDPKSPEMPLEISPIIIWATMEVNLAIISTCLPLMRPIFHRMLPDSVLGSNTRSNPLTKSDTGSVAGFKLHKLNNMHEMDSCSVKNFPDIETGSISSDEFGRARGYNGPQTFSSVRAEDGQRLHRDFKGIHMPNPKSSEMLRQAPAIRDPKRYGGDWKACQKDGRERCDSETWGQETLCRNIHVRSEILSSWIFREWAFVTTVEEAEIDWVSCWIEENSRSRRSILSWMLSWDLFQESIKRARSGSFPEDLVLRLPWVEEPLKAGTEFEWRISMAAAEIYVANDHRMWCRKQRPTIVVCRAKEFRTLVDQGWAAVMRELKEGEAGNVNGAAQSKDAGTNEVADAAVGDGGRDDGDAATETTTTTTTTINNSTTTTTTTVITTSAGGATTTNTSTTTSSTKRKRPAEAKSRDEVDNKRPKGNSTPSENNAVTIDLEQEK